MTSIADSVGQSTAVVDSGRRRDRFAAQRLLWSVSTLDRVKACGRVVFDGDTGVQLRVTTTPDGARHAGLAGVQTCGSVWCCAVCSAKILAHRQLEIARAVTTWRDGFGGRVAFFTFTVRHDRSQTIDTVWDSVQAAHAAMLDSRAGQPHAAEKIAYGFEVDRDLITTCDVASCGARVVCKVACCGLDSAAGKRHAATGCRENLLTGRALRHLEHCKIGTTVSRHVLPWLRVVEVTVGAKGWHVHQHMAVFLPAATTTAAMQRLYTAMWLRWALGARAAGSDGALQVNHPIWIDDTDQFAKYVTKNTYFSAAERAGFEIARGDLKKGRFGNRSAMELLGDVVAQRDPADIALWHAYEIGSQGRRQMTWAHGARELLTMGVEMTGEEIAAEEVGTVHDTIADLTAGAFAQVVNEPCRKADLLDAAEISDVAAFELLDSWGILGWDVREPALLPPEV